MAFSNLEVAILFACLLIAFILGCTIIAVCMLTYNDDKLYLLLIPIFAVPLIGCFILAFFSAKLDSSDYMVSETENEVIEYDYTESKAVIPKGDNEIVCVDVDRFAYGDKTVLVVERYEYKGIWEEKNVLYISKKE